MASEIITLDVGGTVYKTSIRTLTRYPDSTLGIMFSRRGRLDPSARDEEGRFFIDRDGPMFRYVLNFLRDSSLTLPNDFKDLDLLMQEAEYYQILPLIVSVIEKQMDAILAADDDKKKTNRAKCIVL